MNLPNAHLAKVEKQKVEDYLLNAAHPDNGGKAEFFLSLGFSRYHWGILAEAFRNLASICAVEKTVETKHGCKYIVNGHLRTPIGTAPKIRTIWIIEYGDEVPRLVTAYPYHE